MILIMVSCSQVTDDEPEEDILVRIGDKTISVSEFFQRAEYTVRPAYCKGNYNIDKKIILNSLVAEKLLAIEAGMENELIKNMQFKKYIQGRLEQSMRQWLLKKEGTEKVILNINDIKKAYDLAGRTYSIKYVNIPNKQIAQQIKSMLAQNHTFEEIVNTFWDLDSIPKRKVDFYSAGHDKIFDALFTKAIADEQVIGPIEIESLSFLFLKIDGWTDRIVVSENEVKQRWNDVVGKLEHKKALTIYQNFISKVMRGKKIEFFRETFSSLVEHLAPLYFNSTSSTNELLFQRETQTPNLNDTYVNIEEIFDQPLFKLDEQIWTVKDFKNELERHPLVFRKKNIKKGEFAEQVKLGIVDMIRDKYLTDEAYRRGYDQISIVRRAAYMWQDALLSLHQKNKMLEKFNISPDSTHSINIIENWLNPYIKQLQNQYSQDIELDVKRYNSLELSRIDMVAVQKNTPFPVIVPPFPQLTTESQLDYGCKMYP